MLYARCSAETAIINLMVFLIHVVLRSGAEISSMFIHLCGDSIYINCFVDLEFVLISSLVGGLSRSVFGSCCEMFSIEDSSTTLSTPNRFS